MTRYVNPVPGQSLGRTDQGVDIAAPPGTPVYAIADEKLLGILPNWFRGQPFYYFKELGSGVINYVAEQFRSGLHVGDVVHAGQRIGEVAPSGTGLELGFAQSESAARSGHPSPGYTEGTAMPLGRQYRARVFQQGSSPTSGARTSRQTVVQQAATTWGIPVSILTGVWGMETNFGSNVKTSSAGAVGHFQFLPSTAKGYDYPLTNTPNATQFAQQANSAAHYLSDLLKEHNGDWNAALHAYSGGGYGLKQVQDKAPRSRNFGGGSTSPITRPGGEDPSAPPAGPDITSVLSDWAEAQDGGGSATNQFTAFGPGFIPSLPSLPNPFGLSKGLAQGIHGIEDFLKLLAWIINPANILRMVEFFVGLVFMAFGFQAMLQAYKEGHGEDPLSRSGLGRVSKELANQQGQQKKKAQETAEEVAGGGGGGGKPAAAKSAKGGGKSATAAKGAKGGKVAQGVKLAAKVPK